MDIKAILTAIGILLERGYGKPAQAIDVNANINPLDPAVLARFPDDKLEALAAVARELMANGATCEN